MNDWKWASVSGWPERMMAGQVAFHELCYRGTTSQRLASLAAQRGEDTGRWTVVAHTPRRGRSR